MIYPKFYYTCYPYRRNEQTGKTTIQAGVSTGISRFNLGLQHYFTDALSANIMTIW